METIADDALIASSVRAGLPCDVNTFADCVLSILKRHGMTIERFFQSLTNGAIELVRLEVKRRVVYWDVPEVDGRKTVLETLQRYPEYWKPLLEQRCRRERRLARQVDMGGPGWHRNDVTWLASALMDNGEREFAGQFMALPEEAQHAVANAVGWYMGHRRSIKGIPIVTRLKKLRVERGLGLTELRSALDACRSQVKDPEYRDKDFVPSEGDLREVEESAAPRAKVRQGLVMLLEHFFGDSYEALTRPVS